MKLQNKVLVVLPLTIVLSALILISGYTAFQTYGSFYFASQIVCKYVCPEVTPIAIYKRYSAGSMQSHYYPTIGLNISVPNDWNLSQTTQSINEVATYFSPKQNPFDRFQENLMIKEGRYLQNVTPSRFMNTTLEGLKGLSHFRVIEREDNLNISGLLANKIVYSYDQNRHQYMAMQLSVFAGPAYLTFTYNTELGKYAEYLPVIQKTIASVKIDSRLLFPQTQNSTSVAFVDKSTGVSVQYPQNWTRAFDHYLTSIFAIYAPLQNASDTYYDNIRIMTQDIRNPGESNFTVQKHITGLENYFKANLKNFHLLQNESTSLSASPAYSIAYSFTGNDIMKHKLQRIVSLKDSTIYTIIYDSTENSFDRYLHIFKELLTSFKFIQ
jgi:hypothetical protein